MQGSTIGMHLRSALVAIALVAIAGISIGCAEDGIPGSPSVRDSAPPHDETVGTMAGEAAVDGGAATYRVPIVVPPGRAGMQPSLVLVYNSRSGDGVMGLGWAIAGTRSIHRCPQTPEQDGQALGVSYSNSDRLCLDGQRLIKVNSGAYGMDGSEYRTEIDGYARIIQAGGDLASTTTCFRVEQKDGRISHYGAVTLGSPRPTSCAGSTANARTRPAGATAPLSWLVEKIEDRVGNNQVFAYQDVSNGYGDNQLWQVSYTGYGSGVGDRKVTFNYEARNVAASGATDVASSALAGGLSMQTQALKSVVTSVGGATVRQYVTRYVAASYNHRLLLAGLTECAADGACRRETQFSYNDSALNYVFASLAGLNLPGYDQPVDPYTISTVGDLDGDGTQETVITSKQVDGTHTYLVQFTADRRVQNKVELTAAALAATSSLYADFDGSGRSSMLSLPVQAPGNIALTVWDYSRFPRGAVATGNPFMTVSSSIPYDPTHPPHSYGDRVYAADIDGDGRGDVVIVKPASGQCGSDSIGDMDGVYVYRNLTSGPFVAGQNAQFDTGTRLFCLPRIVNTSGSNTVYDEARIDHIADFDGNGLPDFFLVYDGFSTHAGEFDGIARTVRTQGGPPVATISTCGPQLGLVSSSGADDDCHWQNRYAAHWMDVNGDGLEDLVIARPTSATASTWHLRLNLGNGTFGPEIATTSTDGLVADIVGANYTFRYATKLPVMDVDGDGKPELLTPSLTQGIHGFAMKMCMVKPIRALTTGGGDPCPTAGSINQPNITPGASCPTYACPPDPDNAADPNDPAQLPPNPDSGPGASPLQRAFPYTWNGLPAFASFADNPFHGGLAVDASLYHLRALKFVQTFDQGNSGSFHVDSVETQLISRLHDTLAHPDDLFGDGLADLVTSGGCTNTSDSGIGWGPYPHCAAVNDGTYGPAALPDHTATGPMAQNIALYASINQGSSQLGGSPSDIRMPESARLSPPTVVTHPSTVALPTLPIPYMPGLIDSASNGVSDFASWGYYPLSVASSNGDLAFYSIPVDNGYVDARHYYFSSSMPTVFGMAQNSGNNDVYGFRSSYYGYSEAMYNHVGRGFQGFRSITTSSVVASGDEDRQVRTTTRYKQRFPLAGKVESVTMEAPDTNIVFRKEVDRWICNPGTRGTCPADTTNAVDATCAQSNNASPPSASTIYAPVLDKTCVQNFDLGSGAPASHVDSVNAASAEATVSGWDAYGNLTAQLVTSADDGPGPIVSSHTVASASIFLLDTTNWWVGKLDHSTVTSAIVYNAATHAVPSGASAPARSVATAYLWNPDRTLQSTTARSVNAPVQSLTTALGYPTPSYGLPTSSTVSGSFVSPSPRTTAFGYTADGYFLFTTTNALGQVTTTQHAASDGQVTVTTDPNNLSTTNRYDGFGRLIGTTYLDSNSQALLPAVAIGYARCTIGTPSTCSGIGDEDHNADWAAYKVTRVQGGSPSTVDWYDVLGRTVKHAERGFDGTFIESLSHYDNFGALDEQTTPFLQGTAGDVTAWNHDRLNRVIQKQSPGGELDPAHGDVVTSYVYRGNVTSIKVRAANVSSTCSSSTNLCMDMTRTYDVLGRLEQTSQGNGAVNKYAVTNYWQDGAGNAVAVKDAEGNVIRASYDDFGRRLQVVDPDAGARTFSYDALGEVLTESDARNVSTTSTYDAIGRIFQRQVTNASAASPNPKRILDTWSYDPAGPSGGAGLLGSEQRQTSASLSGAMTTIWQQGNTYESATKRLSSQTTVADGRTMQTGFTWDANGREQTVSYPSSLIVRKSYTDWGDADLLSNDASGDVFWSALNQDAWGNVVAETYGTNISGNHQSYGSTGQIRQKKWTASGAVLDAWTYAYDSFGNVKSQARTLNGASGRSEGFVYDGLQRLTQASRSGVTGNPAAVAYGYTPSGNIDFKSDFSGGTAGSYHYGANGCGPHAASSVSAPSGVPTSYTCDANGNVVGGSTLTAGYDFNNQPWNVARTGAGMAQFEYTPEGTVFKETDSSHTTWFGSNGYEFSLVGTTSVHRHELGPVLVLRQGSTDTIEASLRDRLGSQVALVAVSAGNQEPPLGTPSPNVSPSPSLDGNYTVSWPAVTGATSYVLQEQFNGGSWTTVPGVTGTGDTFVGRQVGVYGYRAEACTSTQCGSFSLPVSEEVEPAGPPAPSLPSNPSSDGRYEVDWNAVPGALGYVLEEQINHVGAWTSVTGITTLRTWRTEGRSEGTYSYRVRACLTQCGNPGASADEVVNTGGGQTPPIPTLGSNSNPSSTGSYTLSWNHAGAPDYYLLTQQGGQTWQIDAKTLRKDFAGVPNGSYTYFIQACNANGCSNASVPLVEVVSLPAGPGVSAWVHVDPNPSQDGRYQVSWATVSGTGIRYQLEEASGGTYIVLGTNLVVTTWPIANKPDGYYGYRVKACDATPLCGGYANSPTEIVRHTPDVPTNVRASPNPSTGNFTVSWDTVTDAAWYEVFEIQDGGAQSVVDYNVQDTHLDLVRGNATYAYQIEACNYASNGGLRCSAMSPVTAAATELVQGAAVPAKPGRIWADTVCAPGPTCTFTIRWDAVAGAQSYSLHEVTEETGATWDQAYPSSGQSTVSAPLTRHAGQGYPQVTFDYSVKACAGANGAGPCSDYRGTAHETVGNNSRQTQAVNTASAYDAFGKTRNGDFTDRAGGTLNELPDTLRGFTGHEHVDDVRLIHMGGRVYDYQLGRFLSVDPIIQNPANSQSFNPYSYIGNNPLSGTDPTGYEACTGSHIDRGNEAGDCSDQGVSTTWVNPPSSSSGSNGAARQGATNNNHSSSASDIGSTKAPVDNCASGPLTCHKEQYNGSNQSPTDLGPVSSHEIDGAGFINGIGGDTDRHADLGAKHLSAEMKPMPSTFTLIDSPSAGPLRDVARIGLTQLGISQAVAKQLADILLDVQHDGHHLDLVCHSGGCAESKAAARILGSMHASMPNIRLSFHAGANNMWLTNRMLDRAGIARFGGINAPGYRYNPHDMVPQVVGGNALLHPVDMMMSIWNAPKLFSGDEHHSPHTLPYRPNERLP